MSTAIVALLISLILLTDLLGCVSCSGLKGRSSRSSYNLKERHHIPPSWVATGRTPSDHHIDFRIGLRQGRFKILEQRLIEVSSPSHPQYGNHLSAEEVRSLVEPSTETIQLVTEWLGENGIIEERISFSANRDWISVDMPVRHLEQLLETEYHRFSRFDGSSEVHAIRAGEWSLPDHLHSHIECIQPTNSFFRLTQPASRSVLIKSDLVSGRGLRDGNQARARTKENPPRDVVAVRDACNVSDVTPLCLRTLYGTLDYEIQVPSKNSMALTNYLGQFNNRSDTSLFLAKYRPDVAPAAWDFTDVSVAGGTNPQTLATPDQLEHGKGKEGNLDIQAMLGIAYPTPLTIYSTRGTPPPFRPTAFAPNNTNEPYLIWLEYMLALPDAELPKVISTSYGDIEHTLPPSYARRVCNPFAQLGARGVSLIFGSGDSGVGHDGMCHTNHNDGTPETPEFPTGFPDACPYVTSVGATMGINPEQVAVLDEKKFVSGGGFSRYFPRPKWQDGPVQEYIESLAGAHAGMYDAQGVAYPDVSAQGYEYAVFWNGTERLMSGTSASAPTFATIIALVNDALLAEGKQVLGFLNPWIWEMGKRGEGFTDVVHGSAKGCNSTGFSTQAG